MAEKDSAIYIIDSTIPFKNRRHAFEQAKKGKVEKNTPLLHHLTSLGFQKVQIVPIVVGSHGAWDPENNTFLKLDVYILHLTDVQQYSIDAANVYPNPDATGEIPMVKSQLEDIAQANKPSMESASPVVEETQTMD
ncbi:hypothetical protein TNIN_367311, partial [Trichonephila inaurata madagascariensis]